MDKQQPLSDFTYLVLTPNEDYKLSVIEKSGIKGHFTLLDVETHEAKLNKMRSELKGQIILSKAQADNIERNHEFVLKLTEQDLFTAALYNETTSTLQDCAKKLDMVEAGLKEYEDEKNLILEALGLPKAEPVLETSELVGEPALAEVDGNAEPENTQKDQ